MTSTVMPYNHDLGLNAIRNTVYIHLSQLWIIVPNVLPIAILKYQDEIIQKT